MTGRNSRLGRWVRRTFLGGRQLDRLREELATQAPEIEGLAGRNAGADWAQRALTLVQNARAAADDAQVDRGWGQLLEAGRLAVPALRDEELAARVASLRPEAAAKLTGWRQSAALGLLKNKPHGGRDGRVAQLQEALRILHDHFKNEYRKLAMLRAQVLRAALIITAALVVTMVVMVRAPGVFGEDAVDQVRIAMLFGIFGGGLSVAMSFGRGSVRIPRQLATDAVTWMRPIIGGGAAMVVYVFLRADVLPFVELRNQWVVAALSFLAGFSERWFLGVVADVGRRAREGGSEGGSSSG